MTYNTLALLADAYIPILLLVALWCVFAPIVQFRPNSLEGSKKFVLKNIDEHRGVLCRMPVLGLLLLQLLGLVALAYFLMFLDNKILLWPSLGLDYSTHTAVALALAVFICLKRSRLLLMISISLMAYALLMVYQGYHTVEDIVSTSAVYLAMIFMIKKLFAWATYWERNG